MLFKLIFKRDRRNKKEQEKKLTSLFFGKAKINMKSWQKKKKKKNVFNLKKVFVFLSGICLLGNIINK